MNSLAERLIALAAAGVVLFNYPILSAFAVDGTIAGAPVLYLYLFTAWAALILLVALALRRNGRGGRGG